MTQLAVKAEESIQGLVGSHVTLTFLVIAVPLFRRAMQLMTQLAVKAEESIQGLVGSQACSAISGGFGESAPGPPHGQVLGVFWGQGWCVRARYIDEVGHIYTVCKWYFWQGNHETFGLAWCIYTDLTTPVCREYTVQRIEKMRSQKKAASCLWLPVSILSGGCGESAPGQSCLGANALCVAAGGGIFRVHTHTHAHTHIYIESASIL
jgi:hypothetical protein